MRLFSKKEKNDLKKFIAERPKFADAEQTFSVEELQLMKSQNMGEKIWWEKHFLTFDIKFHLRNTLQLSPELGPRFCQVNLGLTNVPIGEEIKSVLNLISLPAHVRIGKLYKFINSTYL